METLARAPISPAVTRFTLGALSHFAKQKWWLEVFSKSEKKRENLIEVFMCVCVCERETDRKSIKDELEGLKGLLLIQSKDSSVSE